MNEKKKMGKGKKALIIVISILVVLFIGIMVTPTDTEEGPTTTESTTKESTTKEPETTETTVAPRKEAIGKSDQNADELIDGMKPYSMRNDVTGNWKVVKFASPKGEVEKYALDYYNKYFEKIESNEVHWLVNYTNNTTTSISCFGSFLEVRTYEYVDKEEHDAHAIGGGMPLTSYFVWLDNGDIEKI